ncbi:MAG: YIP1 family protein [Oscillospiraceae bacterium]|nr:YIP1 family protein [Oscillospiraceae bacterium]
MKPRQQKIRKIVLSLLSLLLLTALFAGSVGAAEPFVTYTYNNDLEAVQTAAAYRVEQIISGRSLGLDDFYNPSDLCVDQTDCVYILDGYYNRIVVLNPDLTLKEVINPTNEAGEGIEFRDATGIYVAKDGRIMVADKQGETVYILDASGKQIGSLVKPESALLSETFIFAPIRVLEDSGGVIYVISAGSYQGALQYDADGSFLGFFGSEKVVVTPKVLLNYVWKKILSDEQASGIENALPIEFVSFDMDANDFIYTVRQGNDVTIDQVRRLNAKGGNILMSGVYGDYGRTAMLTDICVDDRGFFTILDSGTGKMFQYSEKGALLYIFGGIGDTDGCFWNPIALVSHKDKLLVLDQSKNTVTVFSSTEFGANIRSALELEKTGDYLAAEPYWKEVLKTDFRYESAGVGLGKAAERREEFEAAMDYYRLGNDRSLYSSAFGKVRDALIREWFVPGLIVLILLVIVYYVFKHFRKKRKKEIYGGGRKKSAYPLYCVAHPLAGFEDMKNEKSGDIRWAMGILAAFFAVVVLATQSTGFIFNPNKPEDFNLLVTALSSLGLVFIFVICNWAITTVMDGKGNLKEILIFTSYALVPYIFGTLFMVLCSLFLTEDEFAFYEIFQTIVWCWTGLQLFIALKAVHMYDMKRNVWTIFLTIAGLVIIVVVCAIIYSVFSQFIGFLGSVVIGELLL